MIFHELFYENRQVPNPLLYVRQSGELLCDPAYSISRQNSPTHTLGFLKQGKLHVRFEEQEYTLPQGKSIFLPRDRCYSIAADPEDPPHFLWANLRGELIDSLAETLFPDGVTASAWSAADAFEQLKELLRKTADCHTQIAALLFSMLLHMHDMPLNVITKKQDAAPYELYISNSIQTGFSVEGMAAHFCCSTDSLNRHFHKKYGMTPYQYYLGVRMAIAKTMLMQTKLTLEDIAERLHFSDRNHLSLCFKKATGMSPAQYRKASSQVENK